MQATPHALLIAEQESPDRSRRALIVGVAGYDASGGYEPLHSPLRDSLSVASTLRKRGNFDATLLHDPTRRDLVGELENLFANDEDVRTFVFYFAGHGDIGANGELLLCARDSVRRQPLATTLEIRTILHCIQRARIPQKIVILDCCFAGAARYAANIPAPQMAQRISVSSSVRTAIGTYLIMSTSGAQLAADGDGERLSPFTRHLVAGLDGNGDLNGDGYVTIDELFDYVRDEMAISHPEQTPSQFLSLEEPGEIILAKREDGQRERRRKTPKDVLSLAEQYSRNALIPFVGLSTFGTSNCSAFAIGSALVAELGLGSALPFALASTAQFFESKKKRPHLIDLLRDTVERPSNADLRVSEHLFRALSGARPRLVISSTYDHHLEDRLCADHKVITVISHARGVTGSQTVRFQYTPETLEAAKSGVTLIPTDIGLHRGALVPGSPGANEPKDPIVVYKPLGAPYINSILSAIDPTTRSYSDTVVITEADHVRLLRDFEHQDTRVPNSILVACVQRSLLFLGYPMDVWQYRLVCAGFRECPSHVKPSFALRNSPDPIERSWWEFLSTEVVDGDLRSFADEVIRQKQRASS